jgi:hypothetical protein
METMESLRADVARLTAERDAALAGAVRVKSLVWENFGSYEYAAGSGLGYRVYAYGAVRASPIVWVLEYGKDFKITECESQDAAKAAAQANYERRILSAIEPQPAPIAVLPAGWRLVPARIPPEMIGAFWRVKNGHHFHDEPRPTDMSDSAACAAMIAAAPPAPMMTEVQAKAAGMRLAAAIVTKRREDYQEEFGHVEWDTGQTVYPGNGDETVGEWEEIEEAINAEADRLEGKS